MPVEQAEKVLGAISRADSLSGQDADFSPAVIAAIIESALEAYDVHNGASGMLRSFRTRQRWIC